MHPFPGCDGSPETPRPSVEADFRAAAAMAREGLPESAMLLLLPLGLSEEQLRLRIAQLTAVAAAATAALDPAATSNVIRDPRHTEPVDLLVTLTLLFALLDTRVSDSQEGVVEVKNVLVGGVLLFIASRVINAQSLEVLSELPPVVILVAVVVGVACVGGSRSSAPKTARRAAGLTRRLIAEHEAGHAKMCHAHGGRLREVRIGSGWGYTKFKACGRLGRDAARMADVSLAGPYAQALYSGESVRSALDYGENLPGSDWDCFQREAGPGSARVRRHERRVAKVITRNDPAVAALADALMTKGRVSGTEAHRILRKAEK